LDSKFDPVHGIRENKDNGSVVALILNLGARWGKWSALCRNRLTPRKASISPLVEGQISCRVDLDALEKRKSLVTVRNRTTIPGTYSP
jgi:hypothetical protein